MSETAKKILLVEDEPIALTLYQNRLQLEGFQTSSAEDGEVALSQLAKAQPDLVVLDLMLPKVNGTEVLKHIRSEERLKKTPVLVISNAYMTDLSQRVMESGATRGMLKTECTPARLVETVRDMLGFSSAFELSDKPVSDEGQIEAFTQAAEKALADEMALKETREDFIKKAPGEVAKIRESSLAYIKAGATPGSREPLNNLYKLVRFFATRAGLSGCTRTALLANAFEALLFETVYKPEKATISVSQTIAQAVDALERLCQNTNLVAGELSLHAKILVVDDDAVCNLAMTAALKRANFDADSADDSAKALQMAENSFYDVVLLDINMPNMNGFEVCEKLRKMPEYQATPIIFVTSNSDFQNRTRSILSGGNDLIPKPVSPVELVLKTTMRLLQPQGPWAETSAVASVLKMTMRLEAEQMATQNGAPRNGAAATAPVLPATPAETKKPINGSHSAPALEALKMVPENRVESLNPAPDKLSSAEDSGLPDKLKLVETKDEPPKVEVPPILAETLHMAAPESPAETAKPVELPKPVAVEPPKAVASEPPQQSKPVEPAKPIELPKAAEPPKPATVEPPKAVEPPKPATVEPPKVVAAEPPKPAAAEPSKPVEDLTPKTETKIEMAPAHPPEIKAEKPKVDVPPAPEKAAPPAPPTLPTEKIAQPKSDPKPIVPNMETQTKPTFDEAARGVARIIFGDENISEMNVRLTRIALERYNVPGKQNIGEIARGVAQIIFGEESISEMNVRLTRIALERYNITEVLGHTNGSSKPNGAPQPA